MMDFKKMYQVKAKRVRDPSLPPPPTLLGQVKVIKDVQTGLDTTQIRIQQQDEEMRSLKNKLNQALYRIDLLTNQLRKLR